ncbi:serine protease family [Plasmopara halstedii]|uniref:Serine protease family n=1 Tax=Plasmopara halstedii TaxID=4781 RepID=A0A0P1AAP3_PLAHL|nr:serine protease family [Plasmopara halstedii]CEG37382.1 serine protease family [Plasmopara halstedii]|eukprot:XP_024573751.1 serine protease family [Plasmopara halstedii]
MGNLLTSLLSRRSQLILVLALTYFGHKSCTDGNAKLLSHCPTLTKGKYYPPWRLFNGHLQTLRFAYDNRGPIINYRRQLLKLPDGGVVSLDWALLHDQKVPNLVTDLNKSATTSWWRDVDPSRRTMILLPGLTGGSLENYIRSTIAKLHSLKWQCVVLNARGCAQTPVTTAQLFCSAYTHDLRYVVKQLSEKYNFAREAFVGVGFSMGSNILVKYLGEDGDQTPLTGAISVGNPFDLTLCSANFCDSLFNRMTYDKALNKNLRELFFIKSNASTKFMNFPGVNLDAIKASRTVRDFDDALTKYVFHYNTVDDYYSDAGSVKKLSGVRVPLLCINAEDDPISIRSALPKDDEIMANPNIILCTTKSGGHLAFYESSLKAFECTKRFADAPNMWSINPIAEFAEAVRLEKKNSLM